MANDADAAASVSYTHLDVYKRQDRSTLEKLVEAAEAKDLTGYPTAKVEEFQKVLEEAKAVLDNEAVSYTHLT